MTASESFVSRWARLKREADAVRDPEAEAGVSPSEVAAPPDPESEAKPAGNDAEVVEPFDPASLPSVDAITFETDIQPFLQGRVPAALTRAALRQAWTSDPAIRDFIGIAENQWDFNDPEAIPGFGPLLGQDNVQSIFEQAIGLRSKLVDKIAEMPVASGQRQSAEMEQEPATLAPDQTARLASDEPPAVELDVLKSTGDVSGEVAAQERPDDTEEDACPPNRRSHGGALPR
jgi:hypothetical protein